MYKLYFSGIPTPCLNDTYFEEYKPEVSLGDQNQDECQRSDCVQFWVKTESNEEYILHKDEVDIVGMCERQFYCSVQVQCFRNTFIPMAKVSVKSEFLNRPARKV